MLKAAKQPQFTLKESLVQTFTLCFPCHKGQLQGVAWDMEEDASKQPQFLACFFFFFQQRCALGRGAIGPQEIHPGQDGHGTFL